MADDFGVNIEYLLSIPSIHIKAIYKLRKWTHLKIAKDETTIWIRGFTQHEIESESVLKIPFIKRYFLKGAQLVPYGRALPEMVEPNLLWSNIQRGLKIHLPKENFNFFGLEQNYKIKLVPSNENKAIDATIVDLISLKKYIETAPKIRLKNLKWTIIEHKSALIIGSPLLPIRGQDYYQLSSFLIPAGWKLEHENFSKVFKEALGESAEYWYMINENSEISKLSKIAFNSLSKGSFIKSIQSV